MIAILCANSDEISQFIKDIEISEEGHSEDLSYVLGELNGHLLLIATTGVGIRRARKGASYVVQKFKPSQIIIGGLAGALNTELKVGDIVVGDEVISLKKNETYALYHEFSVSENEYKFGALLTESRFIFEPEEKRRLAVISNALAVDMETWGVVEAATQSKTPVSSIRAISDEVEEELPDMAQIYGSDGQLDSTKAEEYFKLSPELLSPYLKFRFTNTPKASKSLCTTLKDLIEDL